MYGSHVLLSVFLKYSLVKFLTGPIKAGVPMLLKKNSHAVAVRCTGDIVLEVRILNAISLGGRKDFFSLGNNS